MWEKGFSHETVFTICQRSVELGGEFRFSTMDVTAGSPKTVAYKKNEHTFWKIPVVDAAELTDWSAPSILVGYVNDDVDAYIQSLEGVTLKRMTC